MNKQTYDITAHGIISDATLPQTEAIQTVLDMCRENGGTVVTTTNNGDGTWTVTDGNTTVTYKQGDDGSWTGYYGGSGDGGNHYHTGGFDVFSPGGGGSSGSDSFDAFCEWMLNSWRQTAGGGDNLKGKPKADKFKAAGAR